MKLDDWNLPIFAVFSLLKKCFAMLNKNNTCFQYELTFLLSGYNASFKIVSEKKLVTVKLP